MSARFDINAGSDLSFAFNWPDGAGGNANLTGYTVSIFRPDLAIRGTLTATLTDPMPGLIICNFQWSDQYTSGEELSFAVQISSGAYQSATDRITVVVGP